MSKKTKRSISTFAILLAVMLLVSIVTWIAAGKTYTGENGEIAEVVGATSSDIFMAPVNGWADAADVITFVFCLGAFLAIVNATGALETGIHTLVRKLHGKELVLVWILMFLFSVGGTTYGMGEETVGFYILLAATIILPVPLIKWTRSSARPPSCSAPAPAFSAPPSTRSRPALPSPPRPPSVSK